MSDRALIMDAIDRIEAARLRLSRSGKFATKDVVEILEAIPAPIVVPEKETAEDNLLTKEIITELKRLTAVLERPAAEQIAPMVHVSPAISAPSVNVSPQVDVRMACLGVRAVVKRHEYGKNQGEIDYVDFIPLQP